MPVLSVPANLSQEMIGTVWLRPQITHVGQFLSIGPAEIGEFGG
jgi:hypothetical protein